MTKEARRSNDERHHSFVIPSFDICSSFELRHSLLSGGGGVMFSKILVAIDGSAASEKALGAAVDLATHYQAAVTAIGVAEVPEVVGMVDEVDELRQSAEQHFRRIGEAAV